VCGLFERIHVKLYKKIIGFFRFVTNKVTEFKVQRSKKEKGVERDLSVTHGYL
jgi:hypothetical protein